MLSRLRLFPIMPKTKSRFTPHAIVETEHTRPSSLWMCAVLGVETLLRIDFPKGLPSACFMRFALSKVPASVPTFGRPISVVLNYRADFAVRYSLDGAVIEVLDAPAKPLGLQRSCSMILPPRGKIVLRLLCWWGSRPTIVRPSIKDRTPI
jgi:hypothetical protein